MIVQDLSLIHISLKTVAVLTVILDFIITPYVPVYTGDKMVSCIFGGVLMGASLAVVFMRGSTTCLLYTSTRI